MLDKKKLLQDLIRLKENDERKAREAESLEEIYTIKGSIINLESLIECIEQGQYDKA